ncbi:hypothetical protein L596_023789 [Steinernema carpocapsae]|uniref:Uncharacterized protein n=1 Tax=Steinernema carpocapsae TaxID=34508 RepID=A0A4U5MES4_STECR|nr:hypothetical protein L596_023789 [Steinernema carpocapsae]
MTTFEAGRPISVDQRKVQTREKLTEIFGSFAEFSDRIAKKNICGLYPMTASPRRPVVSPPQVSHTLPTITVTNGTASSTSASSSSSSHHSSAKEKDSSMMTTEELLQSMQSLVKAKEPIGVLSKPRDACSSTSSASSASSVSSSSASSSVASSSRVQPSTSSVAPSHRSSNGINGSLSSTSSSSRRDRDKERDRERERDHDSRDFRDSKDRRRDLERERRPAKSHRTTEDRPRQRDRDDHRCSNVATTSSAISGRSSKEREEAAETSAPLKAIDSLFSTSSSKRSFRESPTTISSATTKTSRILSGKRKDSPTRENRGRINRQATTSKAPIRESRWNVATPTTLRTTKMFRCHLTESKRTTMECSTRLWMQYSV